MAEHHQTTKTEKKRIKESIEQVDNHKHYDRNKTLYTNINL